MSSGNYSSGDDIEFDSDVEKVMDMIDDYTEQIKREKENENEKGKKILKQPPRISNQNTAMDLVINSEKQSKKNNPDFQTKEKLRLEPKSDIQKFNMNANKNKKSSFLRTPVKQRELNQNPKTKSYSDPDQDDSTNQTFRQNVKVRSPSHYKSYKKERVYDRSIDNIIDTDGEFKNKHNYSKTINERFDNRFQIDSDDDKVYKQRRQFKNDFTPQSSFTRKKAYGQRVDRRSDFQNGLKHHREYPNRTKSYSDSENRFEKTNTRNKRENNKHDYIFKREFDDHSQSKQFSKLDSDSGPTIEYTNKVPFGQGLHLKKDHSYRTEYEDKRKFKQVQRKGFSSEDEMKTENKKDYYCSQRELEDISRQIQKSKVRNVYNPNTKYKRDHINSQRTIRKTDNNSENEYNGQVSYDKRLRRNSFSKFENNDSNNNMFTKRNSYSFKREPYDKSWNNQRKVNRDSSPIIKYRNRNKNYRRDYEDDDQSSQSDFDGQTDYKKNIKRYSISEDESENKNPYNKNTLRNNESRIRREFEDHSRQGDRTNFRRSFIPKSKKFNDVNTYEQRRGKVTDYRSRNEYDDQQAYKQRIYRREDSNSTSESESEDERNPKRNMGNNRAHEQFESETGLSLVSRSEWGAPKPKWGCGPGMKTPVPNVFILTTDKRSCFSEEDCSKEMVFLASRHMKTQLCPDIKYNFVIGGDGRVYEGRGWITRPGLPTEHNKLNKLSLLIGLAGKYSDEYFPEEMREARDRLIDYGVRHKYIDDDYALHSPVD